MFDFYLDEGIDQVCFNVEECEGDHVRRASPSAGVRIAYYRFLSEFWRLVGRRIQERSTSFARSTTR